MKACVSAVDDLNHGVPPRRKHTNANYRSIKIDDISFCSLINLHEQNEKVIVYLGQGHKDPVMNKTV